MSDVLSQNEVESLLAALEPGGSSTPTNEPSKRSGGLQSISVYDFKRPERVSKEQMRAFQALHEGFGREFGASISSLMRSIVEVKLISVDQLTYSEFVFSLDNPTCFNLLQSKGLDGHLILDLNPAIIFPLMDRLLGGGKNKAGTPPSRPLTEIELRLVKRITNLVIAALEHAWANICKLDLHVSQVESNPQLVQIVPPNEVIVLISFEIVMGEIRGIMNLCVPFNTIEPLVGKLSSDTWSTYSKRAIDPRQLLNLETGLATAGVELVAEMGTTKVSAGQLSGLSVGDLIVTSRDQKLGVDVLVEGRPLFRATPGTLKGKYSLQIDQRLQSHRDFIDGKLKENNADVESEQVPTKAAAAV